MMLPARPKILDTNMVTSDDLCVFNSNVCWSSCISQQQNMAGKWHWSQGICLHATEHSVGDLRFGTGFYMVFQGEGLI